MFPSDYIHEPWTWGQFDRVCDSYPSPVFDHEMAARRAKEKIWSIRRSTGHKEMARAVVAKTRQPEEWYQTARRYAEAYKATEAR